MAVGTRDPRRARRRGTRCTTTRPRRRASRRASATGKLERMAHDLRERGGREADRAAHDARHLFLPGASHTHSVHNAYTKTTVPGRTTRAPSKPNEADATSAVPPMAVVRAPPQDNSSENERCVVRDLEGLVGRTEGRELDAHAPDATDALHDVAEVRVARDDDVIRRELGPQSNEDRVARVHQRLHAVARDRQRHEPAVADIVRHIHTPRRWLIPQLTAQTGGHREIPHRRGDAVARAPEPWRDLVGSEVPVRRRLVDYPEPRSCRGTRFGALTAFCCPLGRAPCQDALDKRFRGALRFSALSA